MRRKVRVILQIHRVFHGLRGTDVLRVLWVLPLVLHVVVLQCSLGRGEYFIECE